MLREIAGRPMVEWVWRAAASGLMDPWWWRPMRKKWLRLPRARYSRGNDFARCPSGSDRVKEVARQIDADIYVNIQGDEPTLTAEFFPPLLALLIGLKWRWPPWPCAARPGVQQSQCGESGDGIDGRALYFSRATIPFDRDWVTGYRKHLASMPIARPRWSDSQRCPSPLERVERLEQLRLLENGIEIYVADAPRDTIGVDTEEDLDRAEAVLLGREEAHVSPEERKI